MAKTYGGRWEIERSLRAGGQAETFLVKDLQGPSSEQRYVLKRIRNPDRHGRFEQEVAALRALDHPNIVHLVDAAVDAEKPYLVMEYCVGGSLDEAPRRWQEDPAEALEVFAHICRGVAAAHAKGITHRDIKPANILLSEDGITPVVADFGIAYVADGERHTLTDEAVGARKFTAPELADGRADQISARTDMYSLGKLLYWMLSGGKLFDREQHRQPAWDLARLEAGRQRYEHVNVMLDKMITVEPHVRHASAETVAGIAEHVAGLVRRNVRALTANLAQQCAFCEQGVYRAVVMNNTSDMRNFGITSVASSDWKSLVCDNCGNVQYFRPDHTKRKQWWGHPGEVLPIP